MSDRDTHREIIARFVAVQERVVYALAEPPPGWPQGLALGMVRWKHAGRQHVTFVAKALWSYAHGDGVLRSCDEPPMLNVAEPSWLPGADEDELFVVDDMVPRKAAVDVVLVGHAHAAEPVERLPCSLRIGAFRRDFSVTCAGARAGSLSRAHLLAADGGATVPVGPRRRKAPADDHPADFDFGAYQAAPAAQQLEALDAVASIELHGLCRSAPQRLLRLPGAQPRIEAEVGGHGMVPVDMMLDTLWIDTDAERIAVTWRGALALPQGGREIARLVAAVERQRHAAWRSALWRGTVGYLSTRSDVEAGAPPAVSLEDPRVMAARYLSWLEPAPEPALTLAAYVDIAAEQAALAKRTQRLERLAAHGLSEDRWVIEERAWLEKMGRAALDGDASLSHEYALAFEAAQARHAAPQPSHSLEDYAAIRTQLELGDDPNAALEKHALSPGGWAALERHWLGAINDDDALSTQLVALLTEQQREFGAERARLEAEGAG